MNRHKFKPEAEIIRIQNALPALVSPEDFAAVQQKMQQRKHSTGRFKAQQVYLLSGKITCDIVMAPRALSQRYPSAANR